MPREWKKVRSSTAMRAVNLDRQKFNEAVSQDLYPCAPSTAAGSARAFDEDDLVVLFIFARLLESGMSVRRAGDYACEILPRLRDRNTNPTDRIVFARGTRSSAVYVFEDFDASASYGFGPTLYHTVWHVDTIRKLIRTRVDDENSIIGDDDGE